MNVYCVLAITESDYREGRGKLCIYHGPGFFYNTVRITPLSKGNVWDTITVPIEWIHNIFNADAIL